jgi:hypothetical protein
MMFAEGLARRGSRREEEAIWNTKGRYILNVTRKGDI